MQAPLQQSRREATREATIREIKATALAQMRASGTPEVRLADIARDMRMSAPALYRYFDGRDGLLTALIADAYTDLAENLERARDAVDPTDVGARLVALCSAFRSWSVREREQFALIFGLPVPGYAAPEDGPTIDAARRAMAALQSIAFEAQAQGRLHRPLLQHIAPELCTCMEEKVAEGGSCPAETMQALLHAWAALHGFVSLEAFGHLDMLDDLPRDQLFASLVQLIARGAGIPAPREGWPTVLPRMA